MNFLAPIIHPMFERFYKKFDHIFSEPAQRRNFRLYCSGLTLEIKRKNIWYINEHIIGSDYQPMQHFMSDAPWPYNVSDLVKEKVDFEMLILPLCHLPVNLLPFLLCQRVLLLSLSNHLLSFTSQHIMWSYVVQ